VGDELEEVERPRRPEHAAGDDVSPGARDRAHLAPILVLRLARRLLDRDRLGVVHRAPAALLHQVRKAEVVAELGVVLDVRLAAHRVDRPVAGGDRARRRLLLSHPHLVAPVETLQVGAVGALEAELARDVADLRVGQIADELAQRVGLPLRVRVGEREHVALGLAHRPVLGGDLSLSRAAQEPDAWLALRDLLDDLVRPVGGAVGGDDDLELVHGVVEREQVLEPAADHGLLVMCRDDERDGGSHVLARDRPRAEAGQRPHGRGIADVRPRESAERAPERPLRDHAASSSLTSAR
jgi:hypothetical protein